MKQSTSLFHPLWVLRDVLNFHIFGDPMRFLLNFVRNGHIERALTAFDVTCARHLESCQSVIFDDIFLVTHEIVNDFLQFIFDVLGNTRTVDTRTEYHKTQ